MARARTDMTALAEPRCRSRWWCVALSLCACGGQERKPVQEGSAAPGLAAGAPAPATRLARPAQLPFKLEQLRFQIAHNKLVASAGKLHAVVPSVYRATSLLHGFARTPD